MRVFKCMFCFLTEFSSIFHPTCHGCLQKLGRPGSILQQVVVGGGGGSRVIIWEVGEGGWCKRKNLQISDVQRLASLMLATCILGSICFCIEHESSVSLESLQFNVCRTWRKESPCTDLTCLSDKRENKAIKS